MEHKMYIDKMSGKMVSLFEDIKGTSMVVYTYLKKDGYVYIDELEGKNIDFLLRYPMAKPEMVNRFVGHLKELGVMCSIHNGWIIRTVNYENSKTELSVKFDTNISAWTELQHRLANEIIAVNQRSRDNDKTEFLIDHKTQTASIVINGYTVSEYTVEPFAEAM